MEKIQVVINVMQEKHLITLKYNQKTEFQLKNKTQAYSNQLFDLLGKLVFGGADRFNQTQMEIPKGIYRATEQ